MNEPRKKNPTFGVAVFIVIAVLLVIATLLLVSLLMLFSYLSHHLA